MTLEELRKEYLQLDEGEELTVHIPFKVHVYWHEGTEADVTDYYSLEGEDEIKELFTPQVKAFQKRIDDFMIKADKFKEETEIDFFTEI